MIALLTACLIVSPADCIDERLPIADATTQMGCMLMAPPAIARWTEDHPSRRVVRWRCVSADERSA